jgi:hypothetical protein
MLGPIVVPCHKILILLWGIYCELEVQIENIINNHMDYCENLPHHCPPSTLSPKTRSNFGNRSQSLFLNGTKTRLLVLFMYGTRTNISGKKEENKQKSKANPNSNMSYTKLYLSKCFCFQFEVIFVVKRVSI